MFRKIMLGIIGIALIAFVAIVAGCGTSSSSAATRTSVASLSTSSNVNGQYHQNNTGIKGVTMTADISDGVIKVTMNMNDTSGIFWDGTFNTPRDISGPVTITSAPNTKTLKYDLYASNEKSKQFAYNNGDLSFQFSIMGVSTIVHMSK